MGVLVPTGPRELVNGKSVALVGNGPSILTGLPFGDEIDGHDIVVRFNAGVPSESQRSHLGERTTVLAVGTLRCLQVSLEDMRARPAHVWFMKNTKMGDRQWPKVQKVYPGAWRFPKDRQEQVAGQIGALASSGLVLAHSMAKVWTPAYVTLYGYDCWKDGLSWWYKTRRDAITLDYCVHDGNKERAELQSLGYVVHEGRWVRQR